MMNLPRKNNHLPKIKVNIFFKVVNFIYIYLIYSLWYYYISKIFTNFFIIFNSQNNLRKNININKLSNRK